MCILSEESLKTLMYFFQLGLNLFCAFNRRFDPLFSQLQAKVREGQIGQVHSIKTVARDCPLPGIGYLKTSGNYDFYELRIKLVIKFFYIFKFIDDITMTSSYLVFNAVVNYTVEQNP